MRGEVLHYDEAQGFGFITGADGNRYAFAREDLRRAFPVSKGTVVEFKEGAGQARDIFSIRSEVPTPLASTPATAAATPPTGQQHFGRSAISEGPVRTSLWSYFRRGMTANYANFRDRARRKEYWGFVLFSYLALVTLSLLGVAVDSALGNLQGGNAVPVATISVCVIFVLASILPWIAISVRRQHDIGLSGWFYLLIFVPYIGSIILFVFALIPSQTHDNKWGPVPAGVRIPAPYIPPAPAAT